MKEHKEVKLSFDVVDNIIDNVTLDGEGSDLCIALIQGDDDIKHALYSAFIQEYLTSENKEDFLSIFFEIVSKTQKYMSSDKQIIIPVSSGKAS